MKFKITNKKYEYFFLKEMRIKKITEVLLNKKFILRRQFV